MGYSSSSSLSSSSSSSTQSSSSSSSSSIDSSSSSSESVGNVSSSSSSSLVLWDEIKPAKLGNVAIATATQWNRLAQTIYTEDATYSIGSVFCYLYEAVGTAVYNIHLAIMSCDDDGKPLANIATASIVSTTITENGWYQFSFSISGTTPANGYLSFVMWQDGGNEHNYTLWGYSESSISSTKAWTSYDATTWTLQANTVRAIKVVGSYNAYDLTNFRVTTPPAEQTTANGSLDTAYANYENTTYSDGKVIIDNPKFLASFVVDGSGSMGWNDRFGNRRSLINKLINRYRNQYPDSAVFDIVRFGAIEVDVDSVTSDMGDVAIINIDLYEPTRKPYTFTINQGTAGEGAIYSHGGFTYEVLDGGVNITTVLCNGSGEPDISGILTKVSGIGDATLTFLSYAASSIEDGIVAYGFKNLEKGHTYNIGDLQANLTTIDSVTTTNWQLMSPAAESPTIALGTNGPRDTNSVDIVATENLFIRKPFSTPALSTTALTNGCEVGISNVAVKDATTFSEDDLIDIVGTRFVNMNLVVNSASGKTIEFSPVATFKIGTYAQEGSFVETSVYNKAVSNLGTTASILVRDINTTRNITFFLQTIDGLYLEWDIEPFDSWYINNIYWLDETASLTLTLKEQDGTPLADRTKVELDVDQKPPLVTRNEADSTYVSQTSTVGATKIYVASTTGYVVNDVIDILDGNGNVQTTTIAEIGTQGSNAYITIDDPLQFEVSVANGARIVPNNSGTTTITGSTESKVSCLTPVVNVTTIYTGKTLDPLLLKPYDLNQVPPATSYSSLNLAKEYIQKQTGDIPTIDGNAVLRILPLTEDNLKRYADKKLETSRYLRLDSEDDLVNQLERNSGDLDSIPEPSTTTATTTTSVDYAIETPVYLSSGTAVSAMVTFATEFTEYTFNGIKLPGIPADTALLAKKYTIYPSAVIETTNGTEIARQYFPDFDVYFIPNIFIYSTKDDNTVSYYLEDTTDDSLGCSSFNGYSKHSFPGVYASGTGFTLEYTITDEFILKSTGSLRIRLYSNKVLNLESAATAFTNTSVSPMSSQALNVTPNVTLDSNGNAVQPLSTINQWRQSVNENTIGQVLQDTDSNQTDRGFGGLSEDNSDVISEYANIIGAETTTTTSTGVGFYTNPEQWVVADQYDEYDFQVSIVNGKATVEIPASDVVGLLFVEASYSFGDTDQFEAIATDFLFVSNPIDIGEVSPYFIFPMEGERYEIGANITWMDGHGGAAVGSGSSSSSSSEDGSGVIEDNTIVVFSLPETKVEPTSSVTDDGWAGGVFLGPRQPIVYPPIDSLQDVLCPPTGEFETVNITVYHSSGYIRQTSRKIFWRGTREIESERKFYFYTTASGLSAWADGSQDPATTINCNLFDGINQTDKFVGVDGVNRLLGEEQTGDLPRTVFGANIVPQRTSWGTGTISVVSPGLNQNIGNEQVWYVDETPGPPWNRTISLQTSYKDTNGYVVGGENTNNINGPYPGPSGDLVVPKPAVKFTEPLSISLHLEAPAFLRDGAHSPNIIAVVQWKGEPLTGTLTVNAGTESESEVEYNMPIVTFESGVCTEENSTGDSEPKIVDTRNTIDGCKTVGDHRSCKLDAYSGQVSLSRTVNHAFGGITHSHSCTVDNEGNGSTKSTILLAGTIKNHTHAISAYSVASQNTADDGTPITAHGHGDPGKNNLRSVVVTTLKPTADTVTDLVVNGYVIFDPTNCFPYSGESSVPGKNRMMFSTLRLNGSALYSSTLEIRLETGSDLSIGDPRPSESGYIPSYYTARTVTQTARGFDIRAFANFSSYVDEFGVTHPSRAVDDGERITIDIQAFKPEDTVGTDSDQSQGQETGGVLVMAPGTRRSYLTLQVSAQINSEGQTATAEKTIQVYSNEQWLPDVRSLLGEPTNDTIYIDDAIGSIEEYGASQIHDAVKLAAQRIIQYQTDNTNLKSYKKIIFLLTDGDENTSEYSIAQAINNVNFINGTDDVPVVSISLGNSFGSDNVLLEKYATDTSGTTFNVEDYSNSQLNNLVDLIVTNRDLPTNNGTYKDRIVLDELSIGSQISLPGTTIPVGASVRYRYRTSDDGISWSSWSSWTSSTTIITIDQVLAERHQYFEYEANLFGNENFDSPEITSGAAIVYYKAKDFKIFFQPLILDITDDEYISSVSVTDKAIVPDTSLLSYLVTQSDSKDPDDYTTAYRDKETILPTRYNELMSTVDYKTYTSINGRWPTTSTVSIYKVNDRIPNGELVDVSQYSSNSFEGSITFASPQEAADTFVLCVKTVPSLRLVCDVVNYGDDPVIIDHVCLLYNIMKRVPRDSSRNIINNPIRSRV